MVRTGFGAERPYDDDRVAARSVLRGEHMEIPLGYAVADPSISVHAPDSNITVAVQLRTALTDTGRGEHTLEPGAWRWSRRGWTVECAPSPAR